MRLAYVCVGRMHHHLGAVQKQRCICMGCWVLWLMLLLLLLLLHRIGE